MAVGLDQDVYEVRVSYDAAVRSKVTSSKRQLGDHCRQGMRHRSRRWLARLFAAPLGLEQMLIPDGMFHGRFVGMPQPLDVDDVVAR